MFPLHVEVPRCEVLILELVDLDRLHLAVVGHWVHLLFLFMLVEVDARLLLQLESDRLLIHG